MKVELKLNEKGGFSCYQQDKFVKTATRGMNFTLICKETGEKKLGKIGFSWSYGYFWVSDLDRSEKKVLSDGMEGILPQE